MALFPNPFAGQSTTAQQPVLPRVPWRENPMITTAALSLLGGRNLNEGLANVAATAPAGMAAKSGMQQFMLAQQEAQAKKAEQEARRNQMNEVMKAWPGLSPEQRALFSVQPELFGEYAMSTMGEPKLPTSVQEFQYGQQNPEFADWQINQKRAGAMTTNIDNIGSIPQGYEVFKTPEGGTQMRPIAGGPADTSKNDAARQEQKSRYGDVVLEDIRRAKEKVQNQSFIAPVTGLGGQVLRGIGGTAAADTAQLISTINSSIAFDRLQAMREASPTGGALGAVSERELGLLQSTLGSLEQSQSQEQLLYNLNRLEEIYSTIMQKASAYPNAAEFGFGGSTPAAPAAGVYEWSPEGGLRPAQ